MNKKTLTILVVILSVGIGSVIAVSPAVRGANSSVRDDPTLETQASWSPADFFSATVTYQVNGEIISSSGIPGETTTWKIRVSGGELILEGSVSLGLISTHFGPKSFSLPVGSSTEIPVPNTMGAIKVTAEIEMDARNIYVTEGPASTAVSELHFSSEGVKRFNVKISGNASEGDRIQVSGVEVIPILRLGLKEDVPLVGPGEIAKRRIGLSAFEPNLEGSTVVKSPSPEVSPLPGGNLALYVVIAAIIIIILAVSFVVIVRKRKKLKE